jgi:hypothetical protein
VRKQWVLATVKLKLFNFLPIIIIRIIPILGSAKHDIPPDSVSWLTHYWLYAGKKIHQRHQTDKATGTAEAAL